MKLLKKVRYLIGQGAFHIMLGTFLTKFVAFFGSIFVVRILSKKQYGLLGFTESIYNYLLLIAGGGLSYVILRYVIISAPKKKGGYFNYVIKHSVLRNILIAIIICFANLFIVYPKEYQTVKLWIPIISVLIILQDILNDGLFTLRAFFKNKMYAYVSLFTSVILILGRIIGAKLWGVTGILCSNAFITAFCGISLILYVRRLYPREQSKLSTHEKKEANVYALQYMITNGLWTLFMLNDIFLIGVFMNNPTAVADYKVAYVFPGNISIFATAIGMFTGPYFTKNENDLEWIQRTYKRIYFVSAFIIAIVAGVVFIFAKQIILLVYGQEYLNVIDVMRILTIAAFINSGLRYTTANILAAMGEIKYNMVISIVGIILQICLDIILINKFEIIGVAWTSCIVYSFMAISLLIIFTKKYYNRRIEIWNMH